MTRTELLLGKIAEENGEITQRAIKALRFGLTEVQNGKLLNNAARIMDEYVDLLAVIELLQEENQLPCLQTGHIRNQLPCLEIDMAQRKARINKYLGLSRDLGILVDTATLWHRDGTCHCPVENHNDTPAPGTRCYVCGKLSVEERAK